ncbi:MAG: Sec-independent protein translocase protein TatB [Granulosicoccus sp.]
MFDVGFTEILLIGIVSLIVIGPERLPAVAKTVGQWVGKLQRFVRGVKTDLASEIESGDLKKLIGDQREQINELRSMVTEAKNDLQSTTKDVVETTKSGLTDLKKTVDEARDEVSAEQKPTARSAVETLPSTQPADKAPDDGASSTQDRTGTSP